MRTLELGRVVMPVPTDERLRRLARETIEEMLSDPDYRKRLRELIEDLEDRKA